jgi:hypothetical protein
VKPRRMDLGVPLPRLRLLEQFERRAAVVSDVSASGLSTDPPRGRVGAEGSAVKGTMLWFNEVKDYGFVLTEDGERLYVDRDGFVDRAAPVGRCARLPVTLRVGERDGERVAVAVSLVPDESPRRARRRSSSIRSAR